jgi:hypothetical protein
MQIYISKSGSQEGPFSLETVNDFLKNDVFSIDDFAWYEGLNDWIPVKEIPLPKEVIVETIKRPLISTESRVSIGGAPQPIKKKSEPLKWDNGKTIAQPPKKVSETPNANENNETKSLNILNYKSNILTWAVLAVLLIAGLLFAVVKLVEQRKKNEQLQVIENQKKEWIAEAEILLQKAERLQKEGEGDHDSGNIDYSLGNLQNNLDHLDKSNPHLSQDFDDYIKNVRAACCLWGAAVRMLDFKDAVSNNDMDKAKLNLSLAQAGMVAILIGGGEKNAGEQVSKLFDFPDDVLKSDEFINRIVSLCFKSSQPALEEATKRLAIIKSK